jgi:hypothetical protein
MNRFFSVVTAATLLVVVGAAVGLSAARAGADEVPVPFERLPDAVQASVLVHLDRADITEIEASGAGADTRYEVEGNGIELLLDADGNVLAIEADDDDDAEDDDDDREVEIAYADAPVAVRKAFARYAGGARATEVERITDDGFTAYELSFADGRGESSVVFSAAGELIETEQAIAPGSLPEAIRQALLEAYPDARIVEAESVQLQYYEVELQMGDDRVDVVALATGEIESDDDDEDEDDD